ncbi:MAG: inositol monophosphatase [Spirochaetes bacterium]|nr:MAG: inositol monophosphatase [Spirochaetota bacterium]
MSLWLFLTNSLKARVVSYNILQERLDAAIVTAHDAGNYILLQETSNIRVSAKGLNDSVSDTDIAVEKLIFNNLQKSFPGDRFLGEEQGERGSGNGGRWIIDPIDGTDNYIRSIPNFTISIAYEDSSGNLSLGVVYNPVQKELFSAVKGCGAFINGRTINVSGITDPSSAVSIIAPPRKSYERTSDYFRLMEDIFLNTRDVRRFGSAALELCYVACGRVEAYYEMGLKYYDIAAGMVVLKEAGGRYSSFSHSENLIENGNILATNGYLHDWYSEKIHDNMGV